MLRKRMQIIELLVFLRRETEAGLKFCEHTPEEFRRFRYNDPVEPFNENDQDPREGEGNGYVKVKEGVVRGETTARRSEYSDLFQGEWQTARDDTSASTSTVTQTRSWDRGRQQVRRHDGTSGEIAVSLSPFFPSRAAGVVADPATISVVFIAPILVQILEPLEALGLGTQWELISTRLQALKVRLTVAPTADGASCIESDDRLPYHHVSDDGHVTPAQACPEVDGGFTITTPAANHAALD
ncbi:hypothetical protein D6D27_09584 [Aureobasidium pullulans]|nr:hypothetical protein D6D27_09584 [Aureobasidium pullulans]